MTTTTFAGRNIISINDLSRDDLLFIMEQTDKLLLSPEPNLLRGKVMGSCFFEPSTRTRLSFEAAMARSGGQSVGFTDGSTTSTQKGESLHDAMRMMEAYCDVVVIRHPLEGSAQQAAEAVTIPVINAGDGSHQHPTQTLLDLYSIRECQGQLDDLHIAMVGDLRHGRTVHSLAEACARFGARLYFVAPPALEMPNSTCEVLRRAGVKFSFHKTVSEIIHRLDILYVTRIQEERFSNRVEFERHRGSFVITPELMIRAKSSLRVLHPLPRVDEIDRRLDATPHAYYFQQARNGLHVRMALLGLLLGQL